MVTVNFSVRSNLDDFTVIAMPDTQLYAQFAPEVFLSQTNWIAAHRDRLNIVFVTHLGDIVYYDDRYEEAWQAADTAMSLLDGVVPYGILPGNHDMQAGGQAIFYEKYFPASRYEHEYWWGGSFNGNKNNYQYFSAGGDDYLILHMQYCPSYQAIDWANEVVSKHPDRKVILTTHGYLRENGERLQHCNDKSDGTVTAVQMWNKLIKNNPNILLVLSGHIPGTARRSDTATGRVVHQLLADFQDLSAHEGGYLQVLTFQPRHNRIRVTSYSPYLDRYLTGAEHQFELPFQMSGGKPATGTVTLTAGSQHCVASVEQETCTLSLLEPGKYELVASYSGDLYYQGSISTPITIEVE